MIEMMTDTPEGVTGIRVSGTVTGEELRAFEPQMRQLLDTDEIRFVEVIDPDYEGFGRGGLAEDIRMGFGVLFKHHSAFKRMAIVTDTDWIVHALHVLAWMVPGELKIFGLGELEQAKEWAAG
ncbi:STAS/SEC14 domain-containing protein [[Mycobacterium] burgundiense]|uniref:STAS/SEC14 domain-containing protein n=1 Tax=[Mycobacterium] burgundiense TaxID=3064286 RepID=A0ABM9LM33_9MYCO|nr:STAS/SEC14 domain-containing protein [Mycolicibacterium sp. MU0053]CAJ1501267.1 STAS/SEC14 domain-containing protein [Mycolicibacterium sp. MU0053]